MTAPALAGPFVARTLGPVRAGHVVAFAAGLALAYVLGPSVFLTACAAVLLWIFATSSAERALALFLPAAFRVALAAGVFHFEPPIQIVDLATDETSPLRLIVTQDLWWPRYLVTYPSILVMDHWGMRFADAFSLYCAALLPVTCLVLLACVRVWRRLSETEAFAVGMAFAVLIGAIATQMNGRLIPAHIGMGLILLAQARVLVRGGLRTADGALLVAGTILGHMTSGTGLVAFADVLVAGALAVALRIDRAQVGAMLWILAVFFGPLLLRDLLKNLDYYGGGPAAFVTMLDHGAGILLRRDAWLVPLALAAVALMALAAWRLRRQLRRIPRALWPAALAVPVTGVGGLYGYSTLSMALPALLVLLMAAVIGASLRPHPA